MKALLVAALVVAAIATDREAWAEWKAKWGKAYGSNGEDETRFRIFQSNMRMAEQLTASDSAIYGATKFSDLTSQEFIEMYTGMNVSAYGRWVDNMPVFHGQSNGLTTDWKAKGLVASVKDQGSCGSCWAFSAAASMEGCYAVKNNKAIDLSAQQVVDCCSAGGSDGCNGGWQDSCIDWGMGKDIATWASYPYKAYKGTCKTSGFTVGLPAKTCQYHSVKTEAKILDALAHSTVGVAIDATILQTYVSGIISKCTFSSVNHAVLLVADEDVLTLKNSWGTSWGESGFWRMKKNVNCLNIGYRAALAY